MSNQKEIWMVRIGNHICGPYKTSTVQNLILEQKISEIDEIALPCKSWCYVRDRSEFLETFKKLQLNSSKRFGATSSSASLTETENITDSTRNDQTKELKPLKTQDTKTAPLLEFNDLKVKSKGLNIGKGLAQYSKRRKKISLVLIPGVLFLFLGGYFFGYNKLAYNPLELFTGERQRALEIAWASGDYEKAFKAMQASKSFLKKYRNKYAALLLMRGNEFNLADKALDLVSNKVSSEWKNLKGLSEQYKGRRDLAEGYFLSVLKKKPKLYSKFN